MLGRSASSPGLSPLPLGSPPIQVDWSRLMCYNLDELPETDPHAKVVSPRSLEACASEGIRPQDLTYVPIEAFEANCSDPEVVRLRYSFFEARRQDLLRLARLARDREVYGAPPRNTLSMEDPRETFPNTFLFFRDELQAITPNMPHCEVDWACSPRTEEFKPISKFHATGGGSLAASFLMGTGSPASPVSPLGGDIGSPAGTLKFGGASPLGRSMSLGGTGALGSGTWRSIVTEEGLPDLFQTLKETPGADWMEADMAKRCVNDHIALRKNAQKRVGRNHSDQARLNKTQISALGASFERLALEQERKKREREIREWMAPAPGVAGNTEGQVRAKEHLFKQARELETHKQDTYRKWVERDQALELKQMDKKYQDRIKFAQVNCEDRIRWRHNFAMCTSDRQAAEEGTRENDRRKSAQHAANQNRSANDNALKNELANLRNTARMLNEFQRRRKDTHQDESIRNHKKLQAEKRTWELHAAEAEKQRLRSSKPKKQVDDLFLYFEGAAEPTSPGGAASVGTR